MELVLEESGTHRIAAQAKAANQQVTVESPACSTEVKICKRCDPPTCKLRVESIWRADEGTLRIDAEGSDGELKLTARKVGGQEVEPEKTDEPQKWTVSIPPKDEGDYEVTLQASRPGDSECKPVTCSTVVPVVSEERRRDWEIWIEETEEPEPYECCTSPWLLRTFGLYTAAQGSETRGMFLGSDQNRFTLDFNQGLGAGVDLEYLLAAAQERPGSRLSGWGWTFGLSRVSIDTVWALDSPTFWIRDDDRVPMLSLTTGPRYHWGSENRSWSLYASPLLGFVHFDNATYADSTPLPWTFRADFEDRFAFGADIGFDAFLGDCWGLTGGAQYLRFSTSAGDIDVDVNPLTLRGGVVYRF